MDGLIELIDQSEQLIVSPSLWIKIVIVLLKVLGILIGTKLLLRFSKTMIDRLFKEKADDDRYTRQRNTTLQSVLKSTLRYVVYFIAATMVLAVFGFSPAPILASAGVVGLAVGFGAQSLVKDIISGFFILFEKQFVVGDYVKILDVEGIVEEIGLRVTKIKNFDGDLHIIPNGKIEQVTNLTANVRRVVVDAPIEYEQNIAEAKQVLEELCSELNEEYQDVIAEEAKVLGVQDLAASSVNIRIVAMVEALDSWQMGRVFRQRVKEKLDQNEIGIPYDHLTIVNK
ncbi:MAG: mechanosensitive ion channel family protein [Bacillota bacterium]